MIRRVLPVLLCLSVVSVVQPAAADEVPAASNPAPPVRATKADEPRFDPDTVIVKFREGVSAESRRSTMSRRGGSVRREIGGTRLVVADTEGRSPRTAAADLRRDPNVESVDLNYIRTADVNPNDPLFAQKYQEYLKKVRFPAGWDVTKGASSKTIAVLDTGVDDSHEEFGTRVKAGMNFVESGPPEDDGMPIGHGTAVAGVAAARTNNSKGQAGGAWSSSIVPVKVLESGGSGTDADIIEGIMWAANQNVTVINMSFSGPGGSTALKDAVDYAAITKGIVLVASAGNSGNSVPRYPAAFDNVLAVGATDNSSNIANFSSYGWWVDIVAPGMNIAGPSRFGNNLYYFGNNGLDGTSFSAPLVSAAALLLKVKYPNYTRTNVVRRLQNTARDYGPRGVDPFYGWGRLDVYAALGGPKTTPAAQPAGDALEPNDVPLRATNLATSATATISPEGDVDWFRRTVAAPGVVHLRVTPPALGANRALEMDPVLEVYDPDLRLIARMDASFGGQAETVSFGAPVAGTYYLAVSNYFGTRSPASYTVTVPATAVPVFSGGEVVDDQADSIAAGDFNGDGLQDLVAANGGSSIPERSHKVEVYEQEADGSLSRDQSRSTSDTGGTNGRLRVGDVDGDAKLDVLSASGAGLDVFLQGPTGLDPVTTAPVGAVSAFGLGDVDGDTDLDVVAGGATLRLLTNDGTGAFASTQIPYTGPHHEFEVGDVDGDGDADIVARDSASVRVLRQGPAGLFTEATKSFGPDTVNEIELGNVDADAALEVLVAMELDLDGEGQLRVINVPTTGAIPNPSQSILLSAGGETPYGIAVRDVNGDGRLDVVVANRYYFYQLSVLAILLQNASNTLGAPQMTYIPWLSQPTSVAVGDISGDGVVDVATAGLNRFVVVRGGGQVLAGELTTVRTTAPADFAMNASRNTDPVISFARPIDPATVTAGVKLYDAVTWTPVAVTLSFAANQATLTAPQLLANRPYVVLASGLEDTDGDPVPLYAFRFTTGA